MAQDNTVTVVGNTTREPELRFTPGGQAVTNVGVAVTRTYTKDGEKKEETSFFDVVCWGSLAENVAVSITKGTRIVVTGRLEQKSWESPAGDKRSKVEINAEDVSPSLRWATVSIQRNEKRTVLNGPSEQTAPQASAPAAAAWAEDEPF